MEELFGLIGFHLKKIKSYGNGRVNGSVYKIEMCKIVDIYTGDKEDIDVDIFINLFNRGQILSDDSRLKNLVDTEIRINDNSSDAKCVCKGSVYRDVFHCNLYLDNKVIVKAPVSNVSLYRVYVDGFNAHIAYDFSSDSNVIYIFGDNGFKFKYSYLDRHLERAGYIAISSVHCKKSGSISLELTRFFDYFELTDDKVLYIDNSCEIMDLTSGNVIIKNGCKDLYLGSFLYPNLNRLVLPPSIENVTGSQNYYVRLDENIEGIDLYLSTTTPDRLKIEICKQLFGKFDNLDDSLSFDETYGKYANVHLY
jgi:hypothetical protein